MAESAALEMRMVEAFHAGRAAAEAGEPRDNPHPSDADTAVARMLSVMWARGYSRGNPVVLDLGEEARSTSAS